jgi:hypothetical protein
VQIAEPTLDDATVLGGPAPDGSGVSTDASFNDYFARDQHLPSAFGLTS